MPIQREGAAAISADLTLAPDASAVATGHMDLSSLTGFDPGKGDLEAGRGGTGGGSGQGDGRGGARWAAAGWIHKPSLKDMEPYWPEVARSEHMNGVVLLSCHVMADGAARQCRVVIERPAGAGFGEAAIDASRLFRIRPVKRNGRRMDLPVHVPVIFQAPPKPQTPLPRK